MPPFDILDQVLVNRFEPDVLIKWRRPCQPRVLIVCDGGLGYRANDPFGLWRFIHAITQDAGVTNKPALTLADRGQDFGLPDPDQITVGTDTYPIKTNFRFDTANPAVTLAHYDQIWLFGINPGAFALNPAEVALLSEFMNGGGGVFATGDHASLGRELSGELPRIRRMREWANVPMGTEPDASIAVNRIDTVTDPGADGIFQFQDQSDAIAQRIYPNYQVSDTDGTGPGATQWEARIHPLLMLPGAAAVRSSAASGTTTPADRFTKDIDALPDHPHESVCYAVSSAALLGAAYNLHGQNFPEWQPDAATPAQRIGAQIVAFAVSGGRSVLNGVWKPPVRPQMFGVISAYDGRLAQPYPGKTQRPGRIVCDSTWHHFVNVNLDGTGAAPRMGLGSWSGGMPGAGTFTPGASLQKIYAYYRNIVSWLQPANRVWCSIFWDLIAVRYRPELIEELIDADRLTDWRQMVGVGRDAARLLEFARGTEAVFDAVTSVLRAEADTAALGDLLGGVEIAGSVISRDELMHGVLGALLVRVARLLPEDADAKTAAKVLAQGPAAHVKQLQTDAVDAMRSGLAEYARRIERTQPLMRKAVKPKTGAAAAPEKAPA
jgi:hypothetical protein